MTASNEQRIRTRNDLAWAIAVGGIAVVLFAALLWFDAVTLCSLTAILFRQTRS